MTMPMIGDSSVLPTDATVMTFRDRLRDAKYLSPSGVSTLFDMREVAREGNKKHSIHEFPEQDQVAVQDLGNGSSKFAITAYITGDNYDQEADAFFNSLSERGPGTLTHPRWGDLSVLALTWSQKEGLVEGIRQAIFEIEFARYGSVLWPTTQVNQQANVAASLANVPTDDLVPSVDDFADLAAIVSTVNDVVAAVDEIKGIANDVTNFVNDVTGTIDSVTAEIEGFADEVTGAIDTIMSAPEQLFGAVNSLIGAPADAFNSIAAKVSGYGALFETLGKDFVNKLDEIGAIFSPPTVPTPVSVSMVAAVQTAVVLGMLRATTVGEQPPNASAAVAITEQVSSMVTEMASRIEAIEVATPGYVYPVTVMMALKQSARDAIAAQLATAASLPTERRIILQAAVTPLEFSFRVYGTSEKVGDVISENHLTGDELNIIPAGREMVYYV